VGDVAADAGGAGVIPELLGILAQRLELADGSTDDERRKEEGGHWLPDGGREPLDGQGAHPDSLLEPAEDAGGGSGAGHCEVGGPRPSSAGSSMRALWVGVYLVVVVVEG
jgi:hypothetical protein